MLDDLDKVAWNEVSHAYGPAADLPTMLRAAASTDADEAEEAVDQLFGTVFHQGTVYTASVPAVAFLAELAVDRTVQPRTQLLWLLGTMADPDETYGPTAAEVHAAVGAQAPVLLPLLAEADPEVRQAAAYALGQCQGAAATITPRLLERWEVEDDPLVAAALLVAGGRLDAQGCGDWLTAGLGDARPAVRMAAALAIARAGMPWPPAATDAVVSAFWDGNPLPGWVWTDEPLRALLERLDVTGGVPAAVLGRLSRSPVADVRSAVAYTIETLNQASRSAPAVLVPLLGPLLGDPDPDVRRWGVHATSTAGAASALLTAELATAAAAMPPTDDRTVALTIQTALKTLIWLGAPGWRELLAAAWRADSDQFDTGLLLLAVENVQIGYDPALLAAVRQRLGASRGSSRFAHNERVRLAVLLGSWGADAAPALPELVGALEAAPVAVAGALISIGEAATAALPALRAAAGRGEPRIAEAIWRLTGDHRPLLDAIGRRIEDPSWGWDTDADLLIELGEAARPLLPKLQSLLAGTPARTMPARAAQIDAARVVWGLTRDPGAVLPTVEAVLSAGDQPAGTAAAFVPALATTGRALIPPLHALLGDRWARVEAARALWRLGVEPRTLTRPLLTAIADGWPWRAALELLLDLRATDAVPALRELAEQDARAPVSGGADGADGTVWEDERLQTAIRDAVSRLA